MVFFHKIFLTNTLIIIAWSISARVQGSEDFKKRRILDLAKNCEIEDFKTRILKKEEKLAILQAPETLGTQKGGGSPTSITDSKESKSIDG